MKQELRSLALLLFGILLVAASGNADRFAAGALSQLFRLAGLAFGLWGLVSMFFPKE